MPRTDERKDLYELGEHPPLGHVPARMHAQLIRQSRFGEPKTGFAPEVVNVPDLGPNDALVYVMAAGVNYNNVWAGYLSEDFKEGVAAFLVKRTPQWRGR